MAKTFEYKGKTYESDRRYLSKDGSTWEFTGHRDHMTDGSGQENDAPLEWVVDVCGPLTRIG